jgi:FtsP/CotA-like multicopper oxidase with cupredoxin domain
MSHMNPQKRISIAARLLLASLMALFPVVAAHAAAPGITGPTFNLVASTAFLNQPDGSSVYSWGYGCNGTPLGFDPPASLMPGANCPTMQVPGPTLIVTEGQTVIINLTNNLPLAAGNTSILFPDFQVIPTGGVAGLLAQEAAPGGTVTYTFTASTPGTHAYYSGTQGDLQIEMGLYGAIIVVPNNTSVLNACASLQANNLTAKAHWGESDYRHAAAAYDHPKTCYDREYLFQWAEMDPNIHHQALAQVSDAKRIAACATGAATPGCSLEVPTEPYHPTYFLINGRSMPDLMDANYAVEYPHQPYNGNPHLHPGEQLLIRTIGQGRWQHPYHEHGNHVRILARDGNLILSTTNPAQNLAGILMFNTDTTPGQAFDGIFYWTGRGLNWDPYGHHNGADPVGDSLATLPCTPDANGYNTGSPTAVNYFEWCQDHDKPVEANPFGDVSGGGPTTLPNPNIFTNGAWYGGTPYFGPDATLRASSTLQGGSGPSGAGCVTGTTIANAPAGTNPTPNCSPLQPANTQGNPANERGWAFMWHSHNEREITTNNVFPGGMLMMLLVDSREFVIDESL